jgi:hypothetical protein
MTAEQSPPRTLAEDLRSRADQALGTLLRARPDLLNPVPNDLTQLATRAATRASVARALERLDRFALQTAQALAVAPDGSPYRTLRGLMHGGDGELDAAVDAALPAAVTELREQALVWGEQDRPRLVRAARDLLAPAAGGPSPTGLGPTLAEATAAARMSPGQLQQILAEVALPATHDPVSAVTALVGLFTAPSQMAKLLAAAPAEAVDVLERLTWGPPYGEVADVAAAPSPVRWLLARGLLCPAGQRNVVLPREVGLHLRGGRAHRRPEPVPPPVAPGAAHDPAAVDATAAGQAFTAVRTVEELLDQWSSSGPPVLRSGGIGVRDLKRTATALDVPESVAAFWVELAYAAGLLATDGEVDEAWAPTPAYDEWLRLPVEERWAELATAWLTATRTPGLVGTRDAKGRALSALGPGLDRGLAPEVRRRVLELLAALPAGSSATPDCLLARLRWEHPSPTRGPHAAPDTGGVGAGPDGLRAALVRWTVTEAEMLGVTGRGATASHTRALLALPRKPPAAPGKPPAAPGSPSSPAATGPAPADASPGRAGEGKPAPAGPGAVASEVVARRTGAAYRPMTATERATAAGRASALLRPLLPELLDHVLLQADLTAVAPGPLHTPLAETLNVLADVESKGGATVYRFTPESVRRALDAGRTAADLHAFLADSSRTPVPQPLSYLIDDVARRHGRLRVGAACAYVRCDDDALLSELLADRRASGLGLRRLASTVLAAQADPATLLDRLRAMGLAPAAESADGDVMISRHDARRTPPRTPPTPVVEGPPAPDGALLVAAVKAIRAGDRAATAVRRQAVPAPTAPGDRARSDGGLPRSAAAETLATMQAAVLAGESVWIGYVNAEGAASQRVIGPVRVEGGYVTAYDHTTDKVRSFALHRITGVAELADEPTS